MLFIAMIRPAFVFGIGSFVVLSDADPPAILRAPDVDVFSPALSAASTACAGAVLGS